MSARDAFLEALGKADAPAYLSLREPADHGWPERRGVLAELARRAAPRRRQLVSLEPWPAGVLGAGLQRRGGVLGGRPRGRSDSPRRNPYADRIPAGVATVDTEVEGHVVPTLPLMAEPTVSECRFPVDVVYTWVDGTDPAWNAAREQRLAGITGTAQTRESSGQARFFDRDELRYSFRSIHLFAPWVRRIHLVTAGQVPDWLDTDHPMVNLVDHTDILPADGLPTFNSHAIETSLHTIEGLAEHFVYFNDDFFLGPPGAARGVLQPGRPERDVLLPHDDRAERPARRARRTSRPPGTTATCSTRRSAPSRRTTWPTRRTRIGCRCSSALTEAFPEALAATARSPFRNDTDVSTLSSLGPALRPARPARRTSERRTSRS